MKSFKMNDMFICLAVSLQILLAYGTVRMYHSNLVASCIMGAIALAIVFLDVLFNRTYLKCSDNEILVLKSSFFGYEKILVKDIVDISISEKEIVLTESSKKVVIKMNKLRLFNLDEVMVYFNSLKNGIAVVA